MKVFYLDKYSWLLVCEFKNKFLAVENRYSGHCFDDPVVIKDANSPASEELLVFCREKVIQDNFNE